uniref:Hydroxylysine kinase n=1 Tax=Branchiostoma floridae TaxID=7739 RepID=C3Z9Z7_BRAFL|eukprot:XP_002594574.1 hypothetical protein BRAFLDRAFT_77546 [Branchiostoma floridae]
MAQSEKAEEILEKPHLTEEQAGQLVETLYGLKVTSLKPLDSYDDLNFYVKVDGPAAWARGYTLKVMNGTDSKNGALHRPEFVWSLKCLPSLENYLHCLKEERHKDINREIILAFREKVLSRMDDLPHGVMHGDFNDLNVLVEEDPVTPSEYRVCGLLDYGDAIVNPYVFDLAIALMYFMSVVKDPITFGGHLVAGFESVRPLTPAEWDVLYYCVVARASQSYVLGHYTASIHPQNTEYLMVTAGSVWKFIDMWWQTPKEEIYKQWRDIQNK